MKIQVKLFFNLKKYSPYPDPEFELEMDEGLKLGHVLKQLGIPDDFPKVMLINGRPAKTDQALEDGDLLVIFPPVEGG